MDLETLNRYESFLLGFILIVVVGFLIRCCMENKSLCWACDRGIPKCGDRHVSESGVEYECFNGVSDE